MRRLPPQLKSDTGDVLALGVLFVGLGAVLLYIVFRAGTSFRGQVMFIVDTALLVGPGVWYVVAGTMMRRGNQQAVIVSRRIVYAQTISIAAVLGVGLILGGMRGEAGMLLFPAIVAVFFIPALLALLLVLGRIEIALRLLDPGGYAFETIPVARAVPLEDVPPDQSTDNLREK